MSGPDCPRCGKVTTFGSTHNDYPYVCKDCDERFSDKGAPMSKDWRYAAEPVYNCQDCGWSERETRVPSEHYAMTPWQRYRIHLFLEHKVSLPSTAQFDVNGVLIDGD